ncbi:nitronate monooxygenase [Haploplasma modicum]|nr:nitronate monooxygenase [Haploplasma modicum]MCR1809166.1 nitronate monooxygenase [Haploplasma modicum]
MKNICELLDIKYPIIQGAMANISKAELVAAVSSAGGLGVIGSSNNNKEWVRNEIRKVKELTDKPFGVNILLLSPHANDIAELVIEEKVKCVTTGAGNPGPYIEKWKEAGIIVIPVVPSVALAKRMEKAGADAVIAEGMEAGGHIGRMTTFALVPQVSDALSIPVIAAGGIADRKGALAAFALGAKGIQAGTVFLATKECPIHENYKNIVVNAKDTDTVITGSDQAPVRVIKNQMAVEYIRLNKEGASFEELEKLTLGSLSKAIYDGNLNEGSFMAGQISGLVREIKTVKEVIDEFVIGFTTYKESLEIL